AEVPRKPGGCGHPTPSTSIRCALPFPHPLSIALPSSPLSVLCLWLCKFLAPFFFEERITTDGTFFSSVVSVLHPLGSCLSYWNIKLGPFFKISGSRRERCGYRIVRRHRNPEDLVNCVGKGKKNNESIIQAKEALGNEISPEQFVSILLEAEPPNVLVSRPNRPFTEASMMMSLTKLADKELVHMIGWAKKIPGFVELSLYDQVRLLESCWLEVLMVGLMWRSIDHPGKLIFAPDLVLDRDEGKCVEGILEIFDMLLATTSRLRELKLQHKEYICVKAMILLNSSMYPLSSATEEPESNKKLNHLLNSVTDALVWVIAKSGVPISQQTTRLANLLMLLSHVRHMSSCSLLSFFPMIVKEERYLRRRDCITFYFSL
uniref:Estrogen receptor n=1 Tax=Laticauda laticaudata TaxID=8630 RepID=A0A8C5SKP7_LATLA